MNAAILNGIPVKYQRAPLTINGGPYDEDNTPPTDVQAIPGGVVVTTTEEGSNGAQRLADNLVKWAKTGKAIQDSGSTIAGDFPFDRVIEGAAAGAVAGTAVPGIGTAIGAIVGAVAAAGEWVLRQFGGGPSRWENAGPNVHWWFTNYAPQAYLDWLDAQGLQPFNSVQDSAKLLMYWHLQVNGQVFWYAARSTLRTGVYDGVYVYQARFGATFTESAANWQAAFEPMAKQYDDMGVDFGGTFNLYERTGAATGLVYRKRLILDDAGDVLEGEVGLLDPATDDSNNTTGVLVAAGAAALLIFAAAPKHTR